MENEPEIRYGMKKYNDTQAVSNTDCCLSQALWSLVKSIAALIFCLVQFALGMLLLLVSVVFASRGLNLIDSVHSCSFFLAAIWFVLVYFVLNQESKK